MDVDDIELAGYQQKRQHNGPPAGDSSGNHVSTIPPSRKQERATSDKSARNATTVSRPSPAKSSVTRPGCHISQQDATTSPTTTKALPWLQRLHLVHIIDATSNDARDHFALERTWLAYSRTANALVSYAIVVAQLFVLHEDHRTIGRVAAAMLICGGIIVQLVGAWRYHQQETALLDKNEDTRESRAVIPNPALIICGVVVGGVCAGLLVLILVAA